MDATPATLRWAIRLLYVEATTLALVAGLLLYETFTVAEVHRGSAAAFTGFTALVAAALAYLGRSLYRRQPRARAPAIALQLFMLPTAYYMVSGGLAWLGLPVGALALVVIWLLIASSTREALNIR